MESTIIDLTVTPPRLLRPGGLPLEALEEVLGEVAVDRAVTQKLAVGEKPRAPGMAYRHYAPRAPLTVVTGSPMRSAGYIAQRLTGRTGVICFDEFAPLFKDQTVQKLGPMEDKSAQARSVFYALRAFDSTDVTEIFAQCPDDAGLGLAIGNRLKKAAGFHVIDAGSPLVIGITGPTGAGKTSALQALQMLGGLVLDCDAIYHRMLKTDAALRTAITDAFGEVFDENGLDRQKLGKVVFGDPARLEQLNAIIFDYLPRELRRRIDASPAELVGIDAINLVESGLTGMCRRTVAVTAPKEVRIRRIMTRDGIPEEYARLRVEAQKSDDFYEKHCTDVLVNTAVSPEEFRDSAYAYFACMIKEELHHE